MTERELYKKLLKMAEDGEVFTAIFLYRKNGSNHLALVGTMDDLAKLLLEGINESTTLRKIIEKSSDPDITKKRKES